jgi:hypothetical protein
MKNTKCGILRNETFLEMPGKDTAVGLKTGQWVYVVDEEEKVTYREVRRGGYQT